MIVLNRSPLRLTAYVAYPCALNIHPATATQIMPKIVEASRAHDDIRWDKTYRGQDFILSSRDEQDVYRVYRLVRDAVCEHVPEQDRPAITYPVLNSTLVSIREHMHAVYGVTISETYATEILAKLKSAMGITVVWSQYGADVRLLLNPGSTDDHGRVTSIMAKVFEEYATR